MEIFQFIVKKFPSITTLVLNDPQKPSRFDNKNHRHEYISHLSQDLLSNDSLKLCSITKSCFRSRAERDNYNLFRCLLYLLPNLTHLQMFFERSLYHKIRKHEYEDNVLRSRLNHIKYVQIIHFYDEKNFFSNEEVHYLFPNAQMLFQYGDDDF